MESVRGKNPTLIASPPKTMGWVVRVSSNFKLKFLSKRSKNDSKKIVGAFLRPANSAVFKSIFFPEILLVICSSVEKNLFLGYEHFLSSRLNQEMSFFAISVLPIMALSHLLASPFSCLFF